MPLISCPDCEREVSDRAPTCPSCGCPLVDEPPQVIEQTSKSIKGVILVGVMMAMAGFLATTAQNDDVARLGILGIVFGLLIFVLGWLSAWWHHR